MEGCSSSLIMIISVLPTMFVCVLGGWILFMRRRRGGSCRWPPGPRGLPLIGHLHLLGKLPHQSLFELSKVHGPLMLLRLGSVPTVVASSPEMARRILKDHDLAFADRLPTAAGNHMFGGANGMVFSSSRSANWRLLRRLSASELFSPKRLDHFQLMRAAEARTFMRSILSDCDDHATALCCLRPKLLHAMNNLITKMMTGRSIAELAGGEDAARSIVELIVQAPKLVGMFNVGDYLPILAWMDLQGCERRSKKVAAGLNEAFERIVQARLQGSDGGQQQATGYFLDALLEHSLSTPISIVGNFMEMFVGGTDTTSATIEYALAELLSNPEKMQLVQAEIEKVVGGERIVEEGDIAQLPYLVACVKEAMRLHPVVPLLMPHVTKEACQIADFHIPAYTQAYVNVWAIGRDATTWKNPSQFMPERFLLHPDSCVDVQGQHFELLPFGAGRRLCPGMKLGLPIVHLILACLLQGFEWSLSPSQKLDMTDHFGAIMSMKTPLIASATPRLPKEIYS